MSGQQLRSDGGGNASRQSEEQYGDANSELHDAAPFASADDSRPHPGSEDEPTPAGALWPFPRTAQVLVGRVGAPRNNCCIATLQANKRHPRETGDPAVGHDEAAT
jgi:hypothetical protein